MDGRCEGGGDGATFTTGKGDIEIPYVQVVRGLAGWWVAVGGELPLGGIQVVCNKDSADIYN